MDRRILVLSACVSLAFLAACTPPKSVKQSETPTSEGTGVSTGPVTAPSVDVEEGSIRGGAFSAVPELEVVHFDYDSYNLSEQARDILKKNAEYLKSHPELQIQIAGHCDERGTIQYNLGLGQKRAKAARDYYVRLGVPGKTMATISYGKEKPKCRQSNDECWAENRRDETLVRGPETSAPEQGGAPNNR